MSVVALKSDRARFGRYELLPVAELHTDGTYQRPISAWRVRDIVTNYEPILFQPLIIGLRGGKWYVVDGQHRLEAAKELGFERVPCMVYDTAKVEDEARAFVWLQQFRRKITATQKFVARIAYKDVAAVAIAKLLQEHGFEMGDYDNFNTVSKNNRIFSIASVELAYNEGGVKRVDDLLYVLRNAWDGRAAALDRGIIKGLAKFMAANAYGPKALAERLRDIAPYDLDAAARSVAHQRGLNVSEAMAVVIGNLYRGAPMRAKGSVK